MKKFILFVAALFLTGLAQAQLTQKEDGKLYDSNNVPYSGTYIEYHPSGSKRIEMTVAKGLKEGITRIYFENQTVQEERSFKANEMDGIWITYNESGVKIGEAAYQKGIKHGKWTVWDDQGVKRYEMFYKTGAKTGTWSIWDSTGKLVNQKEYK